jgi:HAD superfamily hydrolase (TIGR01509 family)
MNNYFQHHPLPKAVLFDHDGTLVSSEWIHFLAWQKLLETLHIPCLESDFQPLIGQTAPEILAQLLARYRPHWKQEPDFIAMTGSDRDKLNTLALKKNEYYLEIATKKLEPYPGVRDLIDWLIAHGILIAVVSNARRKELLAALDRLQLTQKFNIILARDDVPQPKPSPDPYLHACAFLNIQPQEALVVEDAPTGLTSGLLAGIPCVGVLTNFSESELSQPVAGRPDLKTSLIVKSIVELFEIFKQHP